MAVLLEHSAISACYILMVDDALPEVAALITAAALGPAALPAIDALQHYHCCCC